MTITIPDKSEWPTTVDDVTDWETLFEMQETGLIALVSAAETPEQLKGLAQSIVDAVFNRKHDKSIIAKVTAFLDKLLPEGADPDGFPAMRAGVIQMLRKVKDNRLKKSANFVAKKKKQTKRKPAKGKPQKKRKNRRANPVLEFFRNSNAAKATLILAFGVLVPLGIYIGSPAQQGPEGDVLEHMRWVEDHVYRHLPQDSWVLLSVKQSKKAEIAIEVLITDPTHVKAIKGMRRMARVAILNKVCPEAESGVMHILDQGWRLWVALKTSEEVLTGGTCHY